MSLYLYQVDYTSEAWKHMVDNPQNRVEAIKPAIEQQGGKIVSGYLTFGEHDIIVIADFPDDIAAAAFSIAAAAGGACRSLITTQLLTIEQGVEAMQRAKKSPYQPPA